MSSMNEYDDGRIWYKKKGGVITVGMTEKAFEEIGSLRGIMLPIDGDEVSQDDVVAEIEGESGTFEVIAPLACVINAVNDSLAEELEVLQSDPLDEGWIFKAKIVKSDEENSEEEEEDEE